MNRSQAKELLPLIQAFAEGKPVLYRLLGDERWAEATTPAFNVNMYEYRLKLEPEYKYRPFANAKECWAEMQKHQPFGWIKCKEGYFNIVYVNDYYVGLADKDSSSILLASKNSYQDNAFADGTPFGVKE